MQDWMISINGQQSGPFDDGAVRAMLASGQIPPNAFAWRAGMSDWMPIATVFPPVAQPASVGMPAPPQPRSGPGAPSFGQAQGYAPTYGQTYASPYPQPYPGASLDARQSPAKQKSRGLGIALAIITPGLQRVYYDNNAAMGMLQLFLAYLFYGLSIFVCFSAIIGVALNAWAIYEAATLPTE